jgi:GTPase SAR1 family protein
MGRFVQLVMGPAGVGKSSYCKTMQDHCAATNRTLHVANLDPACDGFEYQAAFDVRDLINLDEVMEEFGYGPNGGLVHCMEFLLQNSEWLKEELDKFGDDDYVLLDCPGQVELYSHLPIMHNLGKQLVMWGYSVVAMYLLDALYVIEPSKFISGCLLSLSCMLQLELPHINVITKCDLANKDHLEQILECEGAAMINALDPNSTAKLKSLSQAISSVVDDYMLVSFALLDVTDEDSIEGVLLRTDHAIQYGEDLEPKEPKDYDNYGDNDDCDS